MQIYDYAENDGECWVSLANSLEVCCAKITSSTEKYVHVQVYSKEKTFATSFPPKHIFYNKIEAEIFAVVQLYDLYHKLIDNGMVDNLSFFRFENGETFHCIIKKYEMISESQPEIIFKYLGLL